MKYSRYFVANVVHAAQSLHHPHVNKSVSAAELVSESSVGVIQNVCQHSNIISSQCAGLVAARIRPVVIVTCYTNIECVNKYYLSTTYF